MNDKSKVKEFFRVIESEKSVEVQYIYPQRQEALDAFNTLVWYCQWKWLAEWDYTTKNLLKAMEEYIEELRYVK